MLPIFVSVSHKIGDMIISEALHLIPGAVLLEAGVAAALHSSVRPTCALHGQRHDDLTENVLQEG